MSEAGESPDRAELEALWLRRLQRERAARKQAEFLIEAKSRELYEANLELSAHRSKLERLVVERTRELEEATDQAQAANRAKSLFLASISHEIRTPLTAILGYSELLTREAPKERHRQGWVRGLRSNSEHLHSLVDNVLDLSQIEAGELVVIMESADVLTLTAEVLAALRPMADRKGVGLTLKCEGPIPRRIETDPLKVRQVLINLVGNAINHTREGSVSVVLSRLGSPEVDRARLGFCVLDTGSGIPREMQAQIFESFVQLKKSGGRPGQGAGLGLSISRRLARLLGGDLEVESELGRGSRFTLTLPDEGQEVAEVVSGEELQDLAWAESSPAIGSASLLHGRRVLVVEDGEDNRRILEYILGAEGGQVRCAVNGQLGVDAFLEAEREGEPFDLVLMDMEMPVMDGYQATGRLGELGCKVPIVALTAGAMSTDRQKCLAAGCAAYLTKPFSLARFCETLNDLLGAQEPTLAESSSLPVEGGRGQSALGDQLPARIINAYLAGLADSAQQLRDASARADWGVVRRLLHQLRGSGGSYGYPEITAASDRCNGSLEDESTRASAIEEFARFLESY